MEFFKTSVEYLPRFLPPLLKGAVVTLEITALSLILSAVLGLILAFLSLSKMKTIRAIAGVYIEVFRGTPGLVQLYIIYFGLPSVGITMSSFNAAVLGLGLNGAAYLSEVFRAGIEGVHHGQMEAALSIGMTWAKALRYIILPQAIRIVLPPITNFVVQLIKDTSIVSTIAAPEILLRARNLASETFLPMHLFVLAAILYFVMSYPLSILARYMEKRMGPAG